MISPLVSVLLSTHNQEKYLKEAIESILKQTYQNLEFLVVNDDSTDSTRSILQKYNDKRLIVIANKKKLGLTKSLNRALRLSKGKYIARMDGDDISTRDRLKTQITFLEKNRDIAAVGSWAQVIDDKGRKVKIRRTPMGFKEINKEIPKLNPFIHSTLVFRAEVFKEIGPYDESFLFAQDYDLMLRITSRFKTANINKALLLYREHPKSVSSSEMAQQLKMALKARFKALRNHDLTLWQSIFLIKPAFSLLIPVSFKKAILKLDENFN